MGSKHRIDLPGGFSQANPRSAIPSLRNCGEAMPSTSCENILRFNDLFIQEDDKCQVSGGAAKTKRVPRIVGGGLRQFSIIVCKKVEAKGRTTYSEVADEIITEFASLGENSAPLTALDEKNIRRRVYDAFNVLMAINVIAKHKREIRWIGFPNTGTNELKELEGVHKNLTSRIQEKANYLLELEEQFVDLQNLMLRNQQMRKSGNIPSDGVALPFILVRTRPQATVEIEISEDMRLVHFDFNGTPFTLHDDVVILKAMRRLEVAEPKHATQSSSDGSTLITNHTGTSMRPLSFSQNS